MSEIGGVRRKIPTSVATAAKKTNDLYNDYLLADLELTDGSEIETVDVQVVIYDLETEEELYTTTVTITVN